MIDEEVMVDGIDEILNPELDADHTERVPVVVDAEVVDSRGDG